MEPSTRLWSLSFAMLIGCYIFGSIPLSISLSERNMRCVSIVGAGLIVGTALSVIIPEGVHALYDGADMHDTHEHHHQTRSLNHMVEKPAAVVADLEHVSGEKYWSSIHDRFAPNVELHSMIGISLSLGFIFMLLIDHTCGSGHSHVSAGFMLERGASLLSLSKGTAHTVLPGQIISLCLDSGKVKSVTATLGLLVHAAADGIALGAAASTTRTDVEMIVFFAIMLHKAPAAFGLSTYLLHESYERSRIRKHLLAFSLAAPMFAVLTFYGLSQNGKETLSSYNGTGLAMLFSAGTFLYVATVHILPELLNKTSSNDGTLNFEHNHGKLSRKELLFLIVGVLTPVFLGLYHKH